MIELKGSQYGMVVDKSKATINYDESDNHEIIDVRISNDYDSHVKVEGFRISK